MSVGAWVVGFISISIVGTGVRHSIGAFVRGYVKDAKDVVGASVGDSKGTGVVGMIIGDNHG